MIKKYTFMALLLVGLTVLGGCNLIPFEDPEEQRLRAEAEATQAPVELPDPRAAIEEDRVFARELRNSVGTVLAKFQVRMPMFSEAGEHGEVFAELNRHYQVEFGEAEAECESFFQMVQRQYGEEWDLLETVEGSYSISYQYRLLDTAEKYICIQKQYIYRTDTGSGHTRFYPDVFLAENGWRLSFDGLFGHNATEAAALVMEGIARWCRDSNVPHERLDSLTEADFIEFYAMDGDSLVFYTEPFMLSTNDGSAYVIELDIGQFEPLMIE